MMLLPLLLCYCCSSVESFLLLPAGKSSLTGRFSSSFRSSPSSRLSFTTQDVALSRRKERVLPSRTTDNENFYLVQKGASFVTFLLGIPIGAIALFLLALIKILVSSSDASTSDEEASTDATADNISTQKGGSRTAIMALWARSQAQQQGFGGDVYAPPLLAECLDSVFSTPAVVVLQVCAWLSRFNYWLTRGVFEDQVAWLLTLGSTGLVIPMHTRTCWLDDCDQAFVQNVEQNNCNVILLGSGYDSRFYRIPELRNDNSSIIYLYEIDAPGTQAEKRKALQFRGIDCQQVVYVACDFEKEDWFEKLLTTNKFDSNLPTLVLWEGVTMYLTETTIRKTLNRIASQSSDNHNWYIAFDYLTDDWTALINAALSIVGEPFRFMVPHKNTDQAVEDLLASCGLELLEHFKTASTELLERYVPETFPGKFDGVLGGYGGYVLASGKKTR